MSVALKALEIAESGDPREEILADLRPYLDGLRIGGPFILVGVYDRGGKQTTTGLYLPQQTEDRYQGKTGLVLKLGEGIRDGINGWDFFDPKIAIGDWVIFNVLTATPFLVGKRTCRLVQYSYVMGVVDRPDAIY